MADKACFVIAPIGFPDSETRKRSDAVLKHVIRPAVASCGYKATRADAMSEPGLITGQVIQRIIDDPLVVADLTESNPNVFYELAERHAVRKPLVQLIAKGERIPFDVAGMRTITVDHRDLDSVEAAKEEIVAQVKSMERQGAVIDSPITVSVDLQRLRESDRPEDRSLAEMLTLLTELRSSVANIEQRLTATEHGLPITKPIGSWAEMAAAFELDPKSYPLALLIRRWVESLPLQERRHLFDYGPTAEQKVALHSWLQHHTGSEGHKDTPG